MANKIKIDNALLKRQQRKATKRSREKKVLCRILIVCEGEKTEPNYFRSFQGQNNGPVIYEIDCKGRGLNTMDVVNEAIRLKCNAEKMIPYDCVWAVFDRDSFLKTRFNSAIAKAKANGIEVAWSNEAFELWYLYHFYNRNTAMPRCEYAKAISEAVNKSGKWKNKKPYKYAKNDPQNYKIMTQYGNQKQAIEWAQSQHQTFAGTQYADHNPCTLVYKLVLQLLGEDEQLIAQVMSKIYSDAPNQKK